MGNQKQKWTAEEEEALLAGIAKHGAGKWKNIVKDPEFAPSLFNRSNIDLKDKWRNLSVGTSGHSSKGRLRLAKVKSITATPYPTSPNSAPTIAQACNASSDTAMDDSSNSLQDGKNASQDEIPQTSATGQKKKKSIPREGLAKKKKSILRKGSLKHVKAKPLPFGARKAQAAKPVGRVRRSARIICSRFRTIPSNPDDPIVID